MPDDFSMDTSTTGLLTLGSYSAGAIEIPGDRDWFAVNLIGGVTYRVDIEHNPDGPINGWLNPSLIGIYDSAGTLIPNTSREGGGVAGDARGFFTPVSDGTYYVSAGAREGEPVYATSGSMVYGAGDYMVRVTDNWDDYTANTSTTGQIQSNGAASGRSDWGGDADWFALDVVAGQQYDVFVNGGPYPGDEDGYLFGVYDTTGTYIANTRDDNSGLDGVALSTFTATDTGTYYVSAGLSPNGPGKGNYRVLVAENDDEYSQDASNPGVVTVGGSATGILNHRVTYRDSDWFAVDLEAGESYTVMVKLGSGVLFSTIDGIRDSDGVRLPGVWDWSGYNWTRDTTAIVSFVAPTTETYYIDVSGFPYTSARNGGAYTVSVIADDATDNITTTARVAVDGSLRGTIGYLGDSDWIAVDLVAGETYVIDMRGAGSSGGSLVDPYIYSIRDAAGVHVRGSSDNDSGTGRDARVVFTPDASGTYYIDARRATDNSATGSTYRVAVERIADDYAGDISTTGTLAPGGNVTGSIETFGDQDWFAVDLQAGGVYRIDLESVSTGMGTLDDAYLYGVYDAAGVFVGARNDDGGVDLNSQAIFTAAASATYFIAAGAYAGAGTGTYTLSVNELISIRGGDGNDWLGLPASGTADLLAIRGGTGIDMMSFSGAASGMYINMLTDQVSSWGGVPFSLVMDSIENVTGTSFDDVFFGSDRAETFRGLGGRDIFVGSDGGRDVYDGGSGSDTLSYQESTAGVSVSLLRGRGWAGDARDDRISNIENLTGSGYDDFIWGDRGNNKLTGGYGDDVIAGNGGDDLILAGFGTDTIVFSGNQTDYSITRTGIRTEVTDNVGLDGTDIVDNAEILRFADGDLIL